MINNKFKHYAIKTSESFLAKDSRTNCLEIYEDELSANKIVSRSSQNISVIPCYVYTEKEHAVVKEMYEMLDHLLEHDCINDVSLDTEVSSLLTKARGEL